jgi:hypothetical protein
MERFENATVNTDTHHGSQDDYVGEMEEEQVWDPVLMDRLSPTEDVSNEFSEERWQKPNVTSPKSQEAIMTQRHFDETQNVPAAPSTLPPMSGTQRSPLSVKQKANDMQSSREKLRQKSLLQSFSVETTTSSSAMPEQQSDSFSTEEGSSVENKTEDREKGVRFSDSVVSSLTDEPIVAAVPPPPPPQREEKASPKRFSRTRETREVKAQAESTPERKKNRFLKKFIGMRGKETAGKAKKDGPTPTKTRQVNGKIIKEGQPTRKVRTTKAKKAKKNKKTKFIQNEGKIGAPRDLKPGMSYRSTPNSAEIVVRKSVVEAELSDEDEDENAEHYADAPADDEPDRKQVGLTVTTSSDDAAQVDTMESFSPPRFDDIEEVTNSYSSSPMSSHNIALPSDQDRRFKFNGEFPNEEMSAITDPTFGTPATDNYYQDAIGEKRADDDDDDDDDYHDHADGEDTRNSPTPNTDPLGHYWGPGQNLNPIDPFAKPFFEDQASDVTTPVENLSHFADDTLPSDVPDDEIEANRSHDTAESEPTKSSHDTAESEPTKASHDTTESKPPTDNLGLASRHEMLKRRTESLEKRKAESEPVVVEDVAAAPRNEIAGRRSEIMERRKVIEEKAKHQNSQEKAKEPPQSSRLTGKAVAYLRQQSESQAQQEQSGSHASPSAARSPAVSVELAAATNQTSGSDLYGDKEVYSPIQASNGPSRDQQEEVVQPDVRPSSSTSLLFKLQGRKVQTITSPPRVSEARGAEVAGARKSSSTTGINSTSIRQSSLTKSSRRGILVVSPQRVDHVSIAKGMTLKRRNRETLILQGKDFVVRPRTKRPPLPRQHAAPPAMDLDESKIKDPIKRAGLRLLAKAAVPIQCEIRRYLAQQAAVDRLWAIIELQSYFRRWRCEAFLLAHIDAASRIQAAFRGWQDRDILETEHYCATQIQKIARTFLVSMQAYDRLYQVIIVQAAARAFIARKRHQRVIASAVSIQKCFRGYQGRLDVATMHVAATIIQSIGRTYIERLQYQFDLVDIIIVQSVARRWLATQRANRIRKIVIVQSVARRWAVYNMLREEENQIEHEAATKIQAAWRSFQATTDFIFALADIIIVQRSVRQWLAVKELKDLKQEARAIKIQCLWRGYKARLTLLYSLVDIIIVQVGQIGRAYRQKPVAFLTS